MESGDKRKKVLLIVLVLLIAAWAVDSFVLNGDKAKLPDVQAKQDKLLNENMANVDLNSMVVFVSGAVNKPGVIKIPAGSRLVDAINAVGGLAPGADISKLNLAAKVDDGAQIIVPGALVVQAATNTSGKNVGGLLNINTASEADLDKLPGVGPAIAQKIVAYRQANGNFKTIEDLKKVNGIGDSKFNTLKDKITT